MKRTSTLAAASLLCLAACGARQRTLDSEALRIQLEPDASATLTDKRTGVPWTLPAPRITLKGGAKTAAKPGHIARDGDMLRFSSEEGTRFQLTLSRDPAELRYDYEPGPDVEEVAILDGALAIEEADKSYYAVPHRMGVMLKAEGSEPYSRRFGAYRTDGYSMAMFGAVKEGSGLLLWWDDPYAEIAVDYASSPKPRLSMSLPMRRSARSVRFQPIGRGGYVEIAKAYREVARRRGFLKTLAEKAKENPNVEKFFGAADFKPFAYMPLAPKTRWNPSDKERVELNFTFEECADLAEHFHNDLGIDRAMLVLNGWINRGYDNRHPDILPAAPPIGGNAGLAACSRRVKALGWLFGLHDNYQDLYRDAPSWDESYLIKNEDGSIRQGGVWAGGQCWLICSRKSAELASREQNVPAVNKLFSPDVYFSDTVFAAGLYECHDRDHPTTRTDDIEHKQKLCDYLRGVVGLFGSEEGREWGVPHADYFEGLMSHKTRWRRPDDKDIILPMFELVFADAIPIYTHQSDRPEPDNPTYILDHLLYAEMPVYYFGKHRYWKDRAQDFKPRPGSEDRMAFAQGGRFNAIDQFIKNTYEVLSPLHRLTALMEMTDHDFLTADRMVEKTRFGDDVDIVVNYGSSDYRYQNALLPQYGFVIKSPSLVAYYAKRYGDVTYSQPSMFVIRSLDGKPLGDSEQVRVYRAFGEKFVPFRGRILEVETEQVIGAS
ncbi:MAG: hypothetical protein KIT09_30905 [Bryobacteraceae bacterium]|nr:hypothetical protein [Bryobacteraceae bacterium]